MPAAWSGCPATMECCHCKRSACMLQTDLRRPAGPPPGHPVCCAYVWDPHGVRRPESDVELHQVACNEQPANLSPRVLRPPAVREGCRTPVLLQVVLVLRMLIWQPIRTCPITKKQTFVNRGRGLRAHPTGQLLQTAGITIQGLQMHRTPATAWCPSAGLDPHMPQLLKQDLEQIAQNFALHVTFGHCCGQDLCHLGMVHS